MLNSSCSCGQIYTNYCYEFSHTLMWYLSLTWCSRVVSYVHKMFVKLTAGGIP
jgi:hypothetical protein